MENGTEIRSQGQTGNSPRPHLENTCPKFFPASFVKVLGGAKRSGPPPHTDTANRSHTVHPLNRMNAERHPDCAHAHRHPQTCAHSHETLIMMIPSSSEDASG